MMRHTRYKYHLAVKQGKREAARFEAECLAAAADYGNAAMFQEMKRHLDKRSSGQEFPNSFEGKVTPTDILEEFRNCYSTLYNSSSTIDEMNVLKQKLSAHIRDNVQMSTYEAMKITPEIVRQAVSMMKPNKADVSCHFTSDALIWGPDILYEQLAAVFRSYAIHGTLTHEILACGFMPLHKGGLKPEDKFDSWRAIAGASMILKCLEYVILILWGDKFSTDSAQFGFKKNSSTGQCSWYVNEISNYYYQRGGMVHCLALDMTKAFDTCLFSKLFKKMIEQGLPAIVAKYLPMRSRKAGSELQDLTLTSSASRMVQGKVLCSVLASSVCTSMGCYRG